MRLSRPGELNDGVAAPGLDPVLGGGLQHLTAVLSVVVIVLLLVLLLLVVVVVVVRVISPITSVKLVDSPGQLCGGESEVITLVTVPPPSLISQPLTPPTLFTLVVSPGSQPPPSPASPASSPPPVTPLCPGDILEKEETHQEQDESHDVAGLVSTSPMSSLQGSRVMIWTLCQRS